MQLPNRVSAINRELIGGMNSAPSLARAPPAGPPRWRSAGGPVAGDAATSARPGFPPGTARQRRTSGRKPNAVRSVGCVLGVSASLFGFSFPISGVRWLPYNRFLFSQRNQPVPYVCQFFPRLAVFVLTAAVAACAPPEPVEVVTLENEVVSIGITPQLGGRVLWFSRRGGDNLIKTSERVITQPAPRVSATAGDMGYLGHIVWVGPQSEWWTRQTVNPFRRYTGAIWPPDPYLVLAANCVVERSAGSLGLEGVNSPVSGVRLSKSFFLTGNERPAVELQARAVNVSGRAISRDLWFNTRVPPSTRVYVPVASERDVRVESRTGKRTGPVMFSLAEGILSLDLIPPPAGKTERRGKVFIQPSQGWMAGFSGNQVFIIEFTLQPERLIHPEQGQVELYMDYHPGDPERGMIEMEVHAPYRRLEPGESMSATETWTALPYEGPDERAAHVDYLNRLFASARKGAGIAETGSNIGIATVGGDRRPTEEAAIAAGSSTKWKGISNRRWSATARTAAGRDTCCGSCPAP